MTVGSRNDGTRQPSDSAEVEGGIEWHRVTLTKMDELCGRQLVMLCLDKYIITPCLEQNPQFQTLRISTQVCIRVPSLVCYST